jgi:hypothetical protein
MDRREQFRGNENRAKHSANINTPTPCSSVSRPASPGELPNGILNGNSVPMTLDSHSGGRHSADNRTVAPGSKPRSAYTTEIRRRLANPGNPVDRYK